MAEIFCLHSYRFAKQCGMTLEESLGYARADFDHEGRCNAFSRATDSKTSKKTNGRVRLGQATLRRMPS